MLQEVSHPASPPIEVGEVSGRLARGRGCRLVMGLVDGGIVGGRKEVFGWQA